MALPSPTGRPGFAEGARLHNEGLHYEAHEAWEELWHEETDDERRLFLQGLIQVTSAFHKVFFQKMPGGAQRLLARGLMKLEPYPDAYLGVALGSFRTGARACAARLLEMEKRGEPVDAFERGLVPRLELISRE